MEFTRSERMLTSFPSVKMTEEEARNKLSNAVAQIQIAWYELQQAKMELMQAWNNNTYSLHCTERIEKAAQWVNLSNNTYYEKLRAFWGLEKDCYESEIPNSVIKEYTKGVEAL